jgi:hypothetical protein
MKPKLAVREAARRAGHGEARWRQITQGYQSVSGQYVPVRAPAETIARMARVVGVTPEQLEEVGRTDAADELRNLDPADEPTALPSIAEMAARIDGMQQQIDELKARGRHREQEHDQERDSDTG